jgi:hypothetical protein
MSLYLGNRRIAPIIRTTGQSGLKILVVESLPTQDIATDAIYLVPKQNPSANDYYDEYIYVDNAWEIFGEDGAVSSVNNKTGAVVLGASDVGALPIGTPIPSKTSDLQNDSGYISGITSSDVTSALGFTPYSADNPSGYVNSTQAKNAAPVQSVNGKTGNVSLSAQDVDALPSNTPIHNVPSGGTSGQVLTKSSNSDYALEWTSPSGSVSSVNGKTGAVVLNAEDVGALPNNTVIPTKTSELTNDSNFITSSQAPVQSVNGQTGTVNIDVPTKTSDLTNDSNFITASQAPVQFVNGQTGTVVLDAEDVGALSNTTVIPTKTSELTNDSGFVTSSGVTRVDLNTPAEPFSLPINSAGVTTLDIGDGLTVSDSSGVELKHKTGTGYKHIPSGGSSGQFLGYSSDGTATWQTLPTPTIPTKTSDLTNDSGFITSAQAPVQSVNGDTGAVVLSASDVGALPDSTAIPSKTSDLTNDSGFITGMTILAYGSSTWQDFLDAYSANKVVYARASSNANPAVGSQTRLAFMAYVNNATNPTSVEFQYYRSVSSHSATQQGDQVFVYTLKSTGWSVITREASVKVIAGTNMTQSYSNDKLTLNAVVPTNVSSFTNDAGYLTLADLPIYQGGVS